MANETDELKEFLCDGEMLEQFLGKDTGKDVRHWLQELLTAREYIPKLEEHAKRVKELEEKITALSHSVGFYVDRNIKLIDENRQLKTRLSDLEQIYAESNRRLLAENVKLKTALAVETAISGKCAERIVELEGQVDGLQNERRRVVESLTARVIELDELLCWITALAYRDDGRTRIAASVKARTMLADMLAVGGYTRELVESRGKDAYWAARAKESEAGGYLGSEKSMEVLTNLLNEKKDE